MPFAVDGRWRAIAMPATWIRAPLRSVRQLGARRDAARQVRPQQLQRMDADRERRVLVVGEHPLPAGLRRQLRDLGGRLERQRELAVAAAERLAARRHAEAPEQLAPRPPLVARARRDERLERVLLHRRTAREVADVGVRAVCATTARASASPTDWT